MHSLALPNPTRIGLIPSQCSCSAPPMTQLDGYRHPVTEEMYALLALMNRALSLALMQQSGLAPPALSGATPAERLGISKFLGARDISNSGRPERRPNEPVSGSEETGTVGPKTGRLVDLGGGKKVDSSIAENVRKMIADAKSDGVELRITSAHRSRQQQEELYQKYLNGTGNLAAKPGTSNHESGLAIDFSNTRGAYAWLKKNAGRYGLKNLPSEPWHYSTNGR